MVRTLGALLTATLAGPYIYVLLSGLLGFAIDPGMPRFSTAVMSLPMLMFIGTLSLVLLALPTLLLAVLALNLAQAMGFRSRRSAMWAGAIIGLSLAVFSLDYKFRSEIVQSGLIGAVTGTVCGWIYWRIAIGRTPANGRAIRTE